MNKLLSSEIRRVLPMVLIGIIGAVGCNGGSSSETQATLVATTTEPIDPCEITVFAQNELPPYGTKVRKEPSKESERIGSVEPNMPISVRGWVKVDEVTYPENPEPWDGGEWFWAEDLNGWVSFPGIRNQETERVRDEDGELIPRNDGTYPSVDDLLKTLVVLDPRCRIIDYTSSTSN